ncbi:MAG: class I adenylate-forming enzyme family protein [Hyphomicrobiales bacterium]
MTADPDAGFNLARHCLAASARRLPEKPALLVALDASGTPSETWTFARLERAVLKVAGGLARLGLQRGDRILLRLGNTSDFPLFFFGAIAGGFVPIPTSTMLTRAEADVVLADSGARLVVARDPDLLPHDAPGVIVLHAAEVADVEHAEPVGYADTRPDDPAFLVYTSGTSGKPKGVLHAQRVILGRRPMHAGWYGLKESDTLLHAGAFNWTYTLGAGLMDPWSLGATSIVYAGDKDPTVWPRLIEAYGATLFAAVPSLYRQILKYNEITQASFPTLRHGLTAGEALHPMLHADWMARTGRPLFEALGMSEISTYISSSPETPTRPGSPGRPQPGRRVAILPAETGMEPLAAGETGVIAVHRTDPGLMLGYWMRPEDTAAAFRGDWFITGDLARLDEAGYLWFEGRSDDLMNTFGYRVAPQEVEAAIAAHPAVADVAVTDVRVDDMVRIIAAFVVVHDGMALAEPELDAWCAERLAAYKRPRRFVMMKALPRTQSGKVIRKNLSDTIA